MTRTKTLFAVLGGLALLMFARAAAAGPTLVSTINGYYDYDYYDTPSLHISNTTAYDFTNVTLTLTGYQGVNAGVVQSISLSNITAGSTDILVWGFFGPETGLFSYDYDDTAPGTSACLAPDPAGNNMGPSYVAGTVSSLCGIPGNFYVTLTAMWNGQPIYSQFSPNTNATGGFVGWEGLDQDGYSETSYDSHSNGGPNGVLANIYVGTPPPLNTPEPGTFVLLGSGLFGLLGVAKRRLIG